MVFHFITYFSEILFDMIDLLKRIFVYDPEERITPIDALQHPFLKKDKEVKKVDDVHPIQRIHISGDDAMKKIFEDNTKESSLMPDLL